LSRDGIEVEVTAQHDEEVIVEPGALKRVVFEMLKVTARKKRRLTRQRKILEDRRIVRRIRDAVAVPNATRTVEDRSQLPLPKYCC
jgi:hypothetical protein